MFWSEKFVFFLVLQTKCVRSSLYLLLNRLYSIIAPPFVLMLFGLRLRICIYLFIYLLTFLWIYLFMYLSFYICIYLFMNLSMNLCIYLCIYLFAQVFIYLCIYLCIYLFIYECMYLFMYLFFIYLLIDVWKT